MKPLVSIIMGSTSDYPVMKKTATLLNEMEIPFEINALSAHRTPDQVEEFASNAQTRGIRVIIAAAGMAAWWKADGLVDPLCSDDPWAQQQHLSWTRSASTSEGQDGHR